MKTCVFITGTNGTGKTAVALELIKRFGGIKSTNKQITICNDERVCLAGPYGGKYGGVDAINKTSVLEALFNSFFQRHEVIIAEGSFLETFGLNLTNAMFTAERHIVVPLYADAKSLQRRISNRSGNRLSEFTLAKQKRVLRSASKWKSIGVAVFPINTGVTNTQQAADFLVERIRQYAEL